MVEPEYRAATRLTRLRLGGSPGRNLQQVKLNAL
jgi:hypothetical protein